MTDDGILTNHDIIARCSSRFEDQLRRQLDFAPHLEGASFGNDR